MDGTLVIGRAVLEPEWRWSRDIQPAVGTPSCRSHHLHLLLQGRFAVEMDDGGGEQQLKGLAQPLPLFAVDNVG